MKTKEQIALYNKEYFSRPEVKTRAKVRNAQRREKRAEYKKTERGKQAESRYRKTVKSKQLQENIRLKTRYGITVEDYQKMVNDQNGACLICGVVPNVKLHIDHCHSTGKIRGLLCGNCNKGIGLLKDNIMFLQKAIDYLLK